MSIVIVVLKLEGGQTDSPPGVAGSRNSLGRLGLRISVWMVVVEQYWCLRFIVFLGIALDDHSANYFISHMQEEFKEHTKMRIKLLHRVLTSTYTFGLVTFNENVTQFFQSFMESNDDYREVMANDAMKHHLVSSI